jgi:hypothetical protein
VLAVQSRGLKIFAGGVIGPKRTPGAWDNSTIIQFLKRRKEMKLSEGLAALAEKAKDVETRVDEYTREEQAKRDALKEKWSAEYAKDEQDWNSAVAEADSSVNAWWSGIQSNYENHKAEQKAKWDAWKVERDLAKAERNAESAEADAAVAVAYAQLVAEEAQAIAMEAVGARAHADKLKGDIRD